MEEQTPIVLAPVPDAYEYTVSNETWEALKAEIDHVVARIDAGEQLVPEDVTQVRSLKKQVEAYLTTFNKAMRDAQANYKNLLAKHLNDIGYGKVEAYIATQQQKQTKEQNDRLAKKQNKLQELVNAKLEGTNLVKTTALASQLLPAFTHRFPIVNSSAKNKAITNWGPYEAVIGSTINMLDVFFSDPIFEGATTLPVTSATMQQLLTYVRDGDINHLSTMRAVFAKDAEYLVTQKLKAEITTKEIALAKIEDIMKQGTPDEKIGEIARIIRIAEAL